MKKVTVLMIAALMGSVGAIKGQSLKEKMQAKLDAAQGKGGKNNFEAFDAEKDDMGVTGSYKGLLDNKYYGLKFVKEDGGNIVNELHYYEKKNAVAAKLSLKESFYSKHNIKVFYVWVSNYKEGYVEFMEVAPKVFAIIKGDRSNNDNSVLPLDATRTVREVCANNPADLETWDIETAQAQVDVLVASLNSEKMEKDTELWMKNKVFADNVGKVVFADQHYFLMKPGYINKPPMVNGKDFKTKLDMAGNMQYLSFFKYPPKVKYAGQEVNIEFEMAGKKTNRVELRGKSSAWSKMVKRVETKDWEYRQHAPRALREYNDYHRQYVQDYAFIQCLYLNKDSFKVGGEYSLTVRIYANRDGENGDLMAEGTVTLLYSEAADKAFNGDPNKPEIKGVWQHFEEFLNE